MDAVSLNEQDFRDHRLTDAEWALFEDQGYFIIVRPHLSPRDIHFTQSARSSTSPWVAQENGISESDGEHLRQQLHSMHAELEERGSYGKDQDIREAVYSRNNRMQEDDVNPSRVSSRLPSLPRLDSSGLTVGARGLHQVVVSLMTQPKVSTVVRAAHMDCRPT